MAFNVGDVVAKIKADATGFRKGLDEAQGMAQKFGGNMQKSADAISNAFGGVIKTIGKVTAALGVSFTALGAGIVTNASRVEQMKISLETLTGSAEEAERVFSNVSEFAAKKPFDLQGLVDVNNQLIAAGFNSDQALTDIGMMGDVLAGLGKGQDDLSMLVLNLQQIQATGRASTMDIRQFAMRGIPIYDALAEVTGKSVAEVQEMITAGKIGLPEVEKALAGMTGEGGKFYKMMEKQSGTFEGKMSNLKDTIGMTLADIGEKRRWRLPGSPV
jgi:tape measure domain-containing protein